jgi:signal transduction histidine kinase
MNLFALSGLFTTVFCLILAVIALIYGKTTLHRLLMLFNIVVGIWGFGIFLVGRATTASIALSAWKFASVGGIFIPIFFYHMVCVFAELQRRKVIIFAYLQGFVFLCLISFTDLVINRTRIIFDSIYYNDATLIFHSYILVWLALTCLSFYELFRYLKKAEGEKRKQSKYLFFGFLVGFMGGTSTLLPIFGIDLYPLGNLTIPIYCLIITSAILRYKFMDIKVDISQFSITAMLFPLVLGIPLGLVFMNAFTTAGLLLGITCLSLMLIVLIQGKTKLHRTWALFNLAVSLWGFGAFLIGLSSTSSLAIINWRLAHIGGIFIPVSFFHTICIFSNVEVKRKKFIIFAYLQGLFFLFLNFTDLFIVKVKLIFKSLYYNQAATLFYQVFFFIWLSLVVWGFYELIVYYKKSSGIKKNQSLYLLVGMLIGFSGGSTNFLPMFGIDIYPFGNFTIPIYCLISTFAILRYQLMDINVVIKRTAVYSLSAGLLTGLFVILVMTITNLFSAIVQVDSFKISVFAAFLIAILFNPLRNKVQTIIDKVFYKKTYDYYATIRKVSRDLASIFDFQKIYSYVGDIIFSTLGLKRIYLLAAIPGGSYGVVYHTKKEDKQKKKRANSEPDSINYDEKVRINNRSWMVRFCKKSGDIIVKDELQAVEVKFGPKVVGWIKSELELFHGETVVPIFVDGRLSLLIILGEKLSGDMFTSEDINLLNTISNQTAIAIKNAGLYKDKIHSERLASIGMMSATFAHEVRNPLTSLKTFAQLMPEKYNDEEFRTTFSKIVEGEIEKIDGLIGDLLDFSTEKKASRVNNFDLVDLVDETINYVKGKFDFEQKNITVEKKYKESEINMSGDATNLRQAFVNIITNGCQAMNGNGLLRVEIDQNRRNVDIAITDTGKGIHPDDVSKIFDPFITTKEVGVGLGLAISKRIVEDHKGKIIVKSELSKGSTFTISLPVQN